MQSPSSLSPTHSPALFVVTLLRRGNPAIHAVERARCTEKNAADREHPGSTETMIEPLANEGEDEHGDRELNPHSGELGAGQTLRGAVLRPLFIVHCAMKLTACEDFHKRKWPVQPKATRRFPNLATSRHPRIHSVPPPLTVRLSVDKLGSSELRGGPPPPPPDQSIPAK